MTCIYCGADVGDTGVVFGETDLDCGPSPGPPVFAFPNSVATLAAGFILKPKRWHVQRSGVSRHAIVCRPCYCATLKARMDQLLDRMYELPTQFTARVLAAVDGHYADEGRAK